MLFNPIIALVLAAISWVFGIVVLNDSASWLGMIPSLLFTAWFAFSLFRPVTPSTSNSSDTALPLPGRKNLSFNAPRVSNPTAGTRPASSPPIAFEKLTVGKLRNHSATAHGLGGSTPLRV